LRDEILGECRCLGEERGCCSWDCSIFQPGGTLNWPLDIRLGEDMPGGGEEDWNCW
jgi:hypothetical protein